MFIMQNYPPKKKNELLNATVEMLEEKSFDEYPYISTCLLSRVFVNSVLKVEVDTSLEKIKKANLAIVEKTQIEAIENARVVREARVVELAIEAKREAEIEAEREAERKAKLDVQLVKETLKANGYQRANDQNIIPPGGLR